MSQYPQPDPKAMQTLVEPSAEEIYNMLMEKIEPELTTYMVDGLNDVYSDETPEEKAERTERYQRAFAEYEKAFDVLVDQWKKEVIKLKNQAIGDYQKTSSAQDTQAMSSLEQSIANQ